MADKIDPFAYQCVIFDLDYTLVKLQIDWRAWERAIFALISKYQPTAPPNSVSHYDVHRYISRHGAAFLAEFRRISGQAELDNYHCYSLIHDSLTLLKQLQLANKQLYLLTSNGRRVALPILTELQLIDVFDQIITADEVANLKPTSAPFALIHEPSRPLSDYLMIGDSASDSGFAASAGIDYLDVTSVSR